MCGYDKNVAALEFHHIDSSKKEFNIDGRKLANGKFEDLLKEADKCILLCSNCHRELHNENYAVKVIKKLLSENENVLNKKTLLVCKDCGKLLLSDNKSGYCSECLKKRTMKVASERRPTKEVLEELLQNNSLNKIGQMYGVSHALVKKWGVKYGIIKTKDNESKDIL